MLRSRLLILVLALSLFGGFARAGDAGRTATTLESEPLMVAPLAKDGGDHNKDAGDRDRENPGQDEKQHPEKPTEERPGAIEYDADYSFYGSVRWSGGAVVAGSRRLVGNNPWLELLAPGMRLEVRGRVEGNEIEVSQVEVRYPRSWSFYEGPAGLVGLSGGRIKVWFTGDDGDEVFKQMVADDDGEEVLLAACYRAGSWRAVPDSLEPEIVPASQGWWLLEGSAGAGGVSWRIVKKLPGDCR